MFISTHFMANMFLEELLLNSRSRGHCRILQDNVFLEDLLLNSRGVGYYFFGSFTFNWPWCRTLCRFVEEAISEANIVSLSSQMC